MRSRARARLIRWMFVGSWIAAQIVGPVSVLALAAGDHSVRPGEAGGILVLGHRVEAGEEHCHTALEVVLGTRDGSSPDHAEHRVRVPDADPARQPDVAFAPPDCAAAHAVIPGVERPWRTKARASRPAIAPQPPTRSTPLLL